MKKKMFDESYKSKLEVPTMALDEWIQTFVSHPVSVQVELTIVKKGVMQQKRKQYKIRVKDPLWPNCPEAIRSDADLLLFFKQVEMRFPTAIVPPAPADLDNTSLLEFYLEKIAFNPFLRNDVAYSDFVDGKFKEYKLTRKKDKKLSEGTLRWLQCVTEEAEVNSDDQFLETIKNEFDLLEKNQRSVMQALDVQVEALSKLEQATHAITMSFEGLLAMERASEKRQPISVSGSPPEMLGNFVEDTINMTNKHRLAIRKAYGASTFKRILADPQQYELGVILTFKKAIRTIITKKKNYERAKDALEKENPDLTGAKQGPLQEKKLERYVEYVKHRQGVLGYELRGFRTQRTLVLKKFFEELAKFNLRGSNEVFKEWKQCGVSIDTEENETFFQKNLDYGNAAAGARKSGTSFSSAKVKPGASASLNQSQAVSVIETPETTVSLLVTASYTPRKRQYLKVVEGEILAAHKAENGLWMATNGQGKKGLVASMHVAVRSKKETHFAAAHKSKPVNAPPPGINVPSTLESAAKKRMTIESSVTGSQMEEVNVEDDVLDDWSVTDDGEVVSPSRPKLDSIQLAMPNPVSKSSIDPKAVTSPSTTSPIKVPQKPQFPALSPRPTLPPKPSLPNFQSTTAASADAISSSNNDEAVGFGSPGPRQTLPSFNSPSPSNAVILPIFPSKPSMPTPPMSMRLPPSSEKRPSLTKEPEKSVVDSVPEKRMHPPMGAPSFLADIKKVNPAKQLKKVPESEKHLADSVKNVKETQAKVSTNTSGGAASGGNNGPPRTGGGGMMGELQMKLNKRK